MPYNFRAHLTLVAGYSYSCYFDSPRLAQESCTPRHVVSWQPAACRTTSCSAWQPCPVSVMQFIGSVKQLLVLNGKCLHDNSAFEPWTLHSAALTTEP